MFRQNESDEMGTNSQVALEPTSDAYIKIAEDEILARAGGNRDVQVLSREHNG